MKEFVKSLFTGNVSSSGNRKRKNRIRPQLENLEDRFLLSAQAWDVRTVTDNPAAHQSAIAANEQGRTVVVWTEQASDADAHAGGNTDIKGRVFFRGSPVTNVFSITTGLNLESEPDVAIAADGQFTVVWTEQHRGNVVRELLGGTRDRDIKAAVFSNMGKKLTNIDVDRSTTDEYDPSIAMDSNGNFVVAYTRESDTWYWSGGGGWFGTYYTYRQTDVLAKAYSATGSKFADIVVASGGGDQYNPSVAASYSSLELDFSAYDGPIPKYFAIAYEQEYGSGDTDIKVVQYRSVDMSWYYGPWLPDAVALCSSRFTIDSSTRADINPDIAIKDTGDMVVVYQTKVDNYSWRLNAKRITFGRLGTEMTIALVAPHQASVTFKHTDDHPYDAFAVAYTSAYSKLLHVTEVGQQNSSSPNYPRTVKLGGLYEESEPSIAFDGWTYVVSFNDMLDESIKLRYSPF